jgi:hypothetical protein
VLVAGVPAFQIHRCQPQHDLDDQGTDGNAQGDLERSPWRAVEDCQGETKQPGEPADTDSHPAETRMDVTHPVRLNNVYGATGQTAVARISTSAPERTSTENSLWL